MPRPTRVDTRRQDCQSEPGPLPASEGGEVAPRLRRARELARVCTPKVTQPPAAGGDDNALPISALAAAALRPGWVSFGARKWVSFAARRGLEGRTAFASTRTGRCKAGFGSFRNQVAFEFRLLRRTAIRAIQTRADPGAPAGGYCPGQEARGIPGTKAVSPDSAGRRAAPSRREW